MTTAPVLLRFDPLRFASMPRIKLRQNSRSMAKRERRKRKREKEKKKVSRNKQKANGCEFSVELPMLLHRLQG